MLNMTDLDNNNVVVLLNENSLKDFLTNLQKYENNRLLLKILECLDYSSIHEIDLSTCIEDNVKEKNSIENLYKRLMKKVNGDIADFFVADNRLYYSIYFDKNVTEISFDYDETTFVGVLTDINLIATDVDFDTLIIDDPDKPFNCAVYGGKYDEDNNDIDIDKVYEFMKRGCWRQASERMRSLLALVSNDLGVVITYGVSSEVSIKDSLYKWNRYKEKHGISPFIKIR